MIELPASPAPNGMEPVFDDRGLTQEGASDLRVDKAGSRWGMNFSFPAMQPDKSRVFTARLVRGKSEGVRIELPLIVPQGSPGSPVVDGSGQSGRFLDVRGFNPGYAIKEGFWLNIVEAATGYSYLYQAFGTAFADASGNAILDLNPGLRAPYADGDIVELGRPWIEGRVLGEEWGWSVPLSHLIALSVPVKENR